MQQLYHIELEQFFIHFCLEKLLVSSGIIFLILYSTIQSTYKLEKIREMLLFPLYGFLEIILGYFVIVPAIIKLV